MSAEEHNDESDPGDRLEESSQVSIANETVKFLSRNRYWTRDYTTGIKLFVKHMRTQNDIVVRYIKFYSDFGFQDTGKKYLEDDIPHTEMARK